MPSIDELKFEILRAIENGTTHRMHRMEILGRPSEPGAIERQRGEAFEPSERGLAGRALTQLLETGHVRPTYTDAVNPEEWLELTGLGRQVLETRRFVPTRPPTGTVTILATDIEGSTEHWDRDSEVMREALQRHDQIVTSTIQTHGGYIFKRLGDGFLAAFSRSDDGVDAAVVIQSQLAERDGVQPLRVRIALNTGTVDLRDGDYFGPTVNKLARILDLAVGGQTLISQTTYELTRDSPPNGSVFRDLGERALKGIDRPERIYDVERN